MLIATQPPWHMWGNTQRVNLRALNPGTDVLQVNSFSGQMLKVSYGRPDTWHWLLGSRLLGARFIENVPAIPAVPGDNVCDIDVKWIVSIGLGRSVVTIDRFETHRFHWASTAVNPVAMTPPVGLLWSTQTKSNRLIDVALSDVPPTITTDPVDCQELVAQEVQVQVEVDLTSSTSNTLSPNLKINFADMEFTAFFAPKSHVRPDWYLDAPLAEQFPGGEIGGR